MWLRFDVPGIDWNDPTLTDARLLLSLSWFGTGDGIRDLNVYAVRQSANADGWIESGTGHSTWATAPGNNNTAAFGDPADSVFLGTMRVDNTGYRLTGKPDGLAFGNQTLLDFLRSDTDGLVTLFLKRVQPDAGENTAIFTKEMGSLYAPGLELIRTQPPAPLSVDLLPDWDEGVSQSDNRTKQNNAHPESAVRVAVGGTVPGALVTLYADGVAIGSAVATSSTTQVLTNGQSRLADGVRSLVARQTIRGVESGASAVLSVMIDTTPPTASVTSSGAAVTVAFSEAIDPATFTLASLSLKRNGVAIALDSRVRLVFENAWTVRIEGLGAFSTEAGVYTLDVLLGTIGDHAGNRGCGLASTSWTVA